MSVSAKLNPHQKEFFNDRASKLLHLSTGFGGGKTFVLCHKILQLSKSNYPFSGGLVCPDYQEFKKDVLPEMEGILDKADIPFKYHGTDHYFQVPWTPGKIYVASADKKIRGPNWAYAGINEVTLISLLRYKEIIGRVRIKGAKQPQIISVGTPEGFASEYYEYFIENPPKNHRLRMLYGTTDANLENLAEDYIGTLEDAYDSKMIEAYRKGLWVNMTGNLFYYSYNPAINEDMKLMPDAQAPFLCSMDFNVDPFCATLWQYDGYKIYGVDQVELKGGDGYDTKKMIQALVSRGYRPQNTVIYPDPAGRQRSTKGKPDIQVLKEAGYNVQVRSVAPSFRARQLNVNNLLDKGRIVIHPVKCKGIRKDFQGVEQDILTQEKNKDNPNLTHFSDGLDYMCDILFPFSGKAKQSRMEKLR